MNKQKLKEILLINQTKLYCVLDGANVPNLPMRLYEAKLPNYCLFSGELSPDVVHVAPYVVNLFPNNQFTEWILEEGFGKNWGVFVHCRFSITEMRRHFRSLVSVHDEKGNPLIFRFYDPRVFRKFIPTCEIEEIKTLFGKVETYFVEAENSSNMISYKIDNDEIKIGEIDLEIKN